MPFAAILKNLVDAIPGASGAILADWEGEAVAHYCLFDEYELKVIGAHKGIILNHMKDLHSKLSIGDLQETVIRTGEQQFVIGTIGSDYSLVITMNGRAVVGCALYHLRQAVKLLEKEIYS